MTGLEEEPDKDGYFVPASLVNKLILGIFASLLSLAGYMVLWAMNDAEWKAHQEGTTDVLQQQITHIESDINSINEKFDDYPPGWLTQQVGDNEKELQRHIREEH